MEVHSQWLRVGDGVSHWQGIWLLPVSTFSDFSLSFSFALRRVHTHTPPPPSVSSGWKKQILHQVIPGKELKLVLVWKPPNRVFP